jgi:hypothetical protein
MGTRARCLEGVIARQGVVRQCPGPGRCPVEVTGSAQIAPSRLHLSDCLGRRRGLSRAPRRASSERRCSLPGPPLCASELPSTLICRIVGASTPAAHHRQYAWNGRPARELRGEEGRRVCLVDDLGAQRACVAGGGWEARMRADVTTVHRHLGVWGAALQQVGESNEATVLCGVVVQRRK